MTETVHRKDEGAVGKGVVLGNPLPNMASKCYLADRQGHSSRIRAAELVVEYTITIPHPVRVVWPIFRNFNLWQSRFGYIYDSVPTEDSFMSLTVRTKPGVLEWEEGRVTYVVRKVVPERLIYMDNEPSPFPGKDCVWTGHNVMSLYEEGGITKILIFMEHTFSSETMSIQELRAETKGMVDSGLVFWRDYFVPDLVSAVESSLIPSA
jgi:hypothetical protein